MTDKTMTLVETIIGNLCDRRGFDSAFDVGDDILQEIKQEMADAITRHLSQPAECLGAAERDAARYRWLRSKNVVDGRLYEVIHDDCQPGYKGMKFEEGLDAAIDTAMQETER